jgi:hypothetical protein
MPSLTNLFLGVPQSHLAGLAILMVILVLAFFILFGKEKISFGQKIAVVLLMFLMALPTILLTLFQLTCVVTGAGFKEQRPWCSLYAWLVAALIVAYCILLVVAAVMSFSKSQSIIGEMPFGYAQFNNMTKEYFANMPEDGPKPPVGPEGPKGPTMPNMPMKEGFAAGPALPTKEGFSAKKEGFAATGPRREAFTTSAATRAIAAASAAKAPGAAAGPEAFTGMPAAVKAAPAAPPAFEGFNGGSEYAAF